MAWKLDIQKLIVLRELKNLTHKDCGAVIGKTARSYSNKERGVFPFTADELCAIANTFGADPRSFFTQKSNNDKKVA